MSDSAAESFRWQAFFQHAAQPIFLLNRQRRILFVNRAWEACTDLTQAEVRGRVCRRRSASTPLEQEETILSGCSPPVETIAGRISQVRRRAPGGAGWWEIQFLPLLIVAEVHRWLSPISRARFSIATGEKHNILIR